MSQQTSAGWSSQRKKITLGGILGAAASLATIATFLTAHTHSPPNPTPPAVSPFPTQPAGSATPAPATPATTATTAGSAYPASAQAQIVSECEASQGAPASYCQCNVTWLQANVPYSMFRQTPATFEQEADGSASC
jgi:hypothetical protein